MAPTTYRSFVDALEALEVTGVVRRFTSGPPAGSTGVADTPAQYVRYPVGEEAPIVFGEQLGWPTLRAEIVILVEPVAQSTQPRNFDLSVDMMDNLSTALREATCITKSKLRVGSIRIGEDLVAGMSYWAVFATVEGHG